MALVAILSVCAGLVVWRVAAGRMATSGTSDYGSLSVTAPPPIARDASAQQALAETAPVTLPRHADRPMELHVEKSRAMLTVMVAGHPAKRFPVAFAAHPEGAKSREGDERTPEGRYILRPHHESPAFGRCFFVCYPNESDAARGARDGAIDQRQADAISSALRRGEIPRQDTALGGLILLHGTRDRSRTQLTDRNWTLGCIAMENADLLELLAAFTPDDRPILEIRP